jgi:Tol biopolymer transport system component
LTPTAPPQSVALFLTDNSRLLDIPADIRDGLDFAHVAYTVANDRETITNLSTAQPNTNVVTLYYAAPANAAGRVPILEVRTEEPDAFFLARDGSSIAYLLDDPLGLATGLYIADISTGISLRISNIPSLTQRGRYSAPSWSPDGRRLAVAIGTGYAMDIFIYDLASATWSNLTASGAYDWMPTWSPDGRTIAFLSDRVECPSWIPGDANACDASTQTPAEAGHIFTFDLTNGQLRQLSEDVVVEAPEWINGRYLSFVKTDPDDLLSDQRELYLGDALNNSVTAVRPAGSPATLEVTSESWSPDAGTVMFQDATQGNRVVLMTPQGEVIATTTDLAFARFGMTASWSADGQRIAVGGVGGQCPYGRVVIDVAATRRDGRFVYTASPLPPNPASMCEPTFSGDGSFAALTGITARSATAPDGRSDVYVVNREGYDQRNMTGTLRGSVRLLGWVGGLQR